MYNIFIYFVIAFSVVVFLFILILDISSFLRVDSEKRDYSNYKGRVLVIVPCKGRDIKLYENLLSVKKQTYTNYEVIAVVDTETDLALESIKNAKIKYIITNNKEHGSGKVRAIATAIKRFQKYDTYVIADSDVLFGKEWLSQLVAPLSDKKIGLSTMYPFFKPLKNKFWSEVKMVWGFVGDSLLENEKRRFGWGGSLAFRRDILDKKSLTFFTNSKYSVSDDISLTKIAKSKGLKIAYVRKPKPIVNCDETFDTFFEWANRQTALTLLGYRKNLYEGLVYYTSEIVLILLGIFLTVFISPIFLIYFIHTLKSTFITYKRSRSKDPKVLVIVFIAPFLYEINLLIASRMKNILWRGTIYKL
ncbi:MAG: glycosyltransferase [Candidatus Micrarchaeia archaeon]